MTDAGDVEHDPTPLDSEPVIAVPVTEEELVTGTRFVKTGTVRVRKEVERTTRQVEMPLVQDVVKVTRVPVNRVVTSMPGTREEGSTLIIPVVEEQIVVQKRLVLTEEIHVFRGREKSSTTQSVELEREHAVVERLDDQGKVIASSKAAPKPTGQFKKRRSLLAE